jgi:choline dehydrogenase-like flavoprotein
LNSRARVEHPEIADPTHKSGALSAVYLAKYALTRQAQNPLLSDAVNVLNKGVAGTATLVSPGAHLSNVARDFGAVVTLGRRWVTKRMFSKRKLPSVVLPTRTRTYTLRIDAEQAPNPDSRVTLAEERDATGARRLHVDWRASELDTESLVRTAALFDEALSTQELGRAKMAPPTRLQATGGHHLGTTRMDPDPKLGVVDVDCKVHGIANAFIASGSVFPTCGYANPTLTIVALALRLADHLEAAK